MATWDEKIEGLCDALQLPGDATSTARGDYKRAINTTFTWMDPSHLPRSEQDALEVLEQEYKNLVKSAPGATGWTAMVFNNLRFGFVAGAGGFAAVAFITKLAIGLFGKNGVHMINIGGPLILCLTEILAGRLRARGAGYAASDTIAFMTHDKLERQYEANASELWWVKLRMNWAPAADKSRWQHRVHTLKANGDQLRVGQQRAFVDILHRELGHSMGTKAPTDAEDAPPMRPFCLFSRLTADDQGNVFYDDKLLFTLDDPASFKKFPGKALVTWPDGKQTNLNNERVPDDHRDPFAIATLSLTAGATVRGLVCDEATFFPLIMALAIAGPAGLYMNRHPERLAAPGIWMDLVVAWTLEVVGMMVTAQLQNIARSYWSGANVVSERDAQIQDKLHTLYSAKEASFETRIDLLEDIDRLAAVELEVTLEKLKPIRTDMYRRMAAIENELGIDRKELRRYGRELNAARQTGKKPDSANFPEVRKLQDAVAEDPEFQLKQAQDRKDSLSDKRQQLNRLRVALRQQRAALEKARDTAKHDRRAASSSMLSSFGTAVADMYKDFGHNLSSFSSRLLSYSTGFTLFGEVILPFAVDALLLQDYLAQPQNGTDTAWSNSTEASAHSEAGLNKAMILMAFQGFWFLLTVGQRTKLLLWHFQKAMYGGYGNLRGLKALLWDSPPPVVAMPPVQGLQGVQADDESERLSLPKSDATSADDKNDKGKEPEYVLPTRDRDDDDGQFDGTSADSVLSEYAMEIPNDE
jgi:hypothetical protein